MYKPLDFLNDLVKLSPKERGDYLLMRTQKQRDKIMIAWTQDERLSLTDTFTLPVNYMVKMHELLAGNPKKGIQPTNRSFYFKPKEEGDVIKLANSRQDGEKMYITIDKPVQLKANKAIQAMASYGEFGRFPQMKGRLEEITEKEYAKLRYEAMRDEEEEQTKVVKARKSSKKPKEKPVQRVSERAS